MPALLLVYSFCWEYGDEGNVFGGPLELGVPGATTEFRVVSKDSMAGARNQRLVLERKMSDHAGGVKWEEWSDRDGYLVNRVLRCIALRGPLPSVDVAGGRYFVDLGTFTWKDTY